MTLGLGKIAEAEDADESADADAPPSWRGIYGAKSSEKVAAGRKLRPVEKSRDYFLVLLEILFPDRLSMIKRFPWQFPAPLIAF